MTDKEYVERCIRQYKAHTKSRGDGSLLVHVDSGLWDLFQGNGFKLCSRFRIIKSRDTGKRSLIQVRGFAMSQPLRDSLLKELL